MIKKIVVILIIITLLSGLGFVSYVKFFKNDNKQKNEKVMETKNEKETIIEKTTEEKIKEEELEEKEQKISTGIIQGTIGINSQVYKIFNAIKNINKNPYMPCSTQFMYEFSQSPNEFSSEEKLCVSLNYLYDYSLSVNEEVHKNGIKYYGCEDCDDYFEKYLPVKMVNNTIKEFFNDSTIQLESISGCPSYGYDQKNEAYYINYNCGGYFPVEDYINKLSYEGTKDAYYIYETIVFINWNEDKGKYLAYIELEDMLSYNEKFFLAMDNETEFYITSENELNFHQYKFKFLKNGEGNWYFSAIEKIR